LENAVVRAFENGLGSPDGPARQYRGDDKMNGHLLLLLRLLFLNYTPMKKSLFIAKIICFFTTQSINIHSHCKEMKKGLVPCNCLVEKPFMKTIC
jgi:hypothetical protein